MKTFGELKIGDPIYFFYMNEWNGPGEILTHHIASEPEYYQTHYEGDEAVVFINIQFNGPDSDNSFSIALEFAADVVSEVIDLEDYDQNYLVYGTEDYMFATDLETIKEKRDAYIKRILERHTKSIERLNGML